MNIKSISQFIFHYMLKQQTIRNYGAEAGVFYTQIKKKAGPLLLSNLLHTESLLTLPLLFVYKGLCRIIGQHNFCAFHSCLKAQQLRTHTNYSCQRPNRVQFLASTSGGPQNVKPSSSSITFFWSPQVPVFMYAYTHSADRDT